MYVFSNTLKYVYPQSSIHLLMLPVFFLPNMSNYILPCEIGRSHKRDGGKGAACKFDMLPIVQVIHIDRYIPDTPAIYIRFFFGERSRGGGPRSEGLRKSGTHDMYNGMYIYIYIHMYMNIYMSVWHPVHQQSTLFLLVSAPAEGPSLRGAPREW